MHNSEGTTVNMKITAYANAKINLFLDIKARRADGYHDIVSIMQSVDLCDTLTVEYTESNIFDITVECDQSNVPLGDDNLVVKAAKKLVKTGRIHVYINKKIPMSAGLAGGSADAAAMLVALNHLLGEPYSITELKTIGATLGADIPFCIEGGACLVEGIGDIMTPITPMPNAPIVISRMGEGMSTPKAYGALDIKYNNFKAREPYISKLQTLMSVESQSNIHAYSDGMFNIFETVVEDVRTCVPLLKETMISCGATKAMMSGSGTSVFGIFQNEDDAIKARDRLIAEGAVAFVAHPTAKGTELKIEQDN